MTTDRILAIFDEPANADPSSSVAASPASELERQRRVEDWIVGTLESRGASASATDWVEALGKFSLAKRTPQVQAGPATSRTARSGNDWPRFRLSSRRKGILVVALTDPILLREADVEELVADLSSLVEAGHRRLVVDFATVERLSTWGASALATAIRKLANQEGVAIKLTNRRAELATIAAVAGLDRAAEWLPDVSSAVEGVWPAPPELRPLPVAILGALVRAETDAASSLDPGRSDSSLEGPDAMPGARLIIQEGPSTGRPVNIKGLCFVIGRGPCCQLRVGSATVSRSHAAIERRGARLVLRDLASTNGTLLNGRKIRGKEVALHDGDRIRIGPLACTVVMPAGALAEPAVETAVASRSLRVVEPVETYEPATEEFADFEPVGEHVPLKVEVIEGVVVVTPLVPELDDEAEVNDLRDALLSLFDRRAPQRVVVNLAHVGHLSGRAIGVLVAHHLRLDRVGGALRLCLASNPRVAAVLDQVKLPMIIDCHPNVDDAVIARWPG
jgi:anti-anti-sigma factor